MKKNVTFSSLFNGIKDFPVETQKSIIEKHQQQKIDELELGLIGKILGKNPHVHYAGILLFLILLFLFLSALLGIKITDNINTFLTHLASIVAGYMFGTRGRS